MRPPALALAAALVLAGCSGFAGPTPTPTVTPAPVPADPTTTPGRPPAALAGERVDARALGFAHAAALTGRSYTVRERTVVRYRNGTVRTRVAVVRRVAADGEYVTTVNASGRGHPLGSGTVRTAFWSDGERLLYAVRRGRAEYGVVRPEEYNIWSDRYVALAYPRPTRTVYVPFRVVDARTVGRTGTGRYRVAGDRTVAPQLVDVPPGVTNPRNATLRAVVDRRGVVRRYRFRYRATAGNATVTVTRHVAYGAIGTTAVERPDWYDRAANASDGRG